MTRTSIRTRLTACYSAVLTLGLALFGFGMWFALRQRLIAGVDTRLEQKLEGLRTVLGNEAEVRGRSAVQQEVSEFAGEIGDGTVIELRDASGALLTPVPDQTPLLPGAAASYGSHFTLDRGGKPYRAIAGSLDAGGARWEVRMALPLDDVAAIMRDFQRLLFLMIPAVLALAFLGDFWLSRRVLRPVDEITAVARSIGVNNLSQRVQAPQTGDELQRMAETWNEVLERLESSVNRIRQFTADASHELRTPLALIRATAELALRRERSTEEYRTALRNVEREADRLTALTESLLSMARADSGSAPLPVMEMDLNPVATSVVEAHQALAVGKGVRLEALAATDPVVAMANESGLRRMLAILLDNALKYTPSGGSVTVRVESLGEGASVSVSDSGEGIAPEALPHIFDRFYRADPARGSGSGFGLGLSIAEAIAKAQGAKIRAESVVGKGSRFSLLLQG